MTETRQAPVVRTCLVTGASRGIGAAVARELLRDGHRVALLGRDLQALDGVRAELPGTTLSVAADVTDPAQIDSAFATVENEWGPVEVLVSNAGAGRHARLVDTSDEHWAAMVDLNLTAPFRLVRRAVPAMLEAGWGRVVVVASVVAKRGEPEVAAYTAAKHGVLGLVRAAAAELARTGVTVNAVCPGYVDTPMTDATVTAAAERTGRSPDDVRAALARQQPIGRLIEPAEVAEAVRFCVANGAVTGQGINVDGGAVQS
ncbi:MAG TPA: SDR family NAD(P)-dependent oxidoreductase [Mycobacteriales bacterium]|jgi:NAD(P)-dependent dehydrogenase (short-subunit alcohol dehydrogenase family)|nr:SDR family NAD(P)-dependent oxidoreductase [Mycobacteriales bacterium]